MARYAWAIECENWDTTTLYSSIDDAYAALVEIINERCYGIYTMPSIEEMLEDLDRSYGKCKREKQSEFGVSGTAFWASKIEIRGEEEVGFIWKINFNDGHTFERYTDSAEMAQRIMEEYILNQGDIYWELDEDGIKKKLDELATSRREDETYFGCTFDDFTSICSAERIALN